MRGNDELWAQRGPLQKVLEAQARQAHEAGAVYCAAFSMPTDAGPVTGSVMVSLVSDPAAVLASSTGGRMGEVPRGGVDSGFTEVPRGDDPLAPFAVTTTVDIETCGPCPRTYGIDDAALGDGAYVRNVFMLTAVPPADP